MYPIAPLTTLDANLVRTGLPVASLLITATALVLAGLLFLRAGAVARRRAEGARS